MRLLWFLVFLALAGNARATTTIVFTVPSTNAYVEGDSVYYCSGGAPTADLAWVRFWRQYVTGEALQLFDSLDVRGKEGQELTKDADEGPGAHFYLQPVDTTGGAGCLSDGLYVPGYVTAVGDDGHDWRKPVSVRFFDIQGRLAEGELASGVYLKVEVYADKRERVTKVVVLR